MINLKTYTEPDCRHPRLKHQKETFLGMGISSSLSIQRYSSDQSHTDLLKWSLLKTPKKSTHASKFTKHLTPLTL